MGAGEQSAAEIGLAGGTVEDAQLHIRRLQRRVQTVEAFQRWGDQVGQSAAQGNSGLPRQEASRTADRMGKIIDPAGFRKAQIFQGE